MHVDALALLQVGGVLAVLGVVGTCVWLLGLNRGRVDHIRRLDSDVRYWRVRNTELTRENTERVEAETAARDDARHWRNLAVQRQQRLRETARRLQTASAHWAPTVRATPEAIAAAAAGNDDELVQRLATADFLLVGPDGDNGEDWSDSGLETQQRRPPGKPPR